MTTSFMDEEEYSYTFKVCILGDGSLKITNFVNKISTRKFTDQHLMTIGMEPSSRYQIIRGRKICFSLWVIAPQDRFRIMRDMFYRGTLCSIVFFDLTNHSTFDNVEKWVETSKQESPNQLVILVGLNNHKVDERGVSSTEAQEKANAIKAFSYFETNIETLENIEELFAKLGETLVDQREKQNQSTFGLVSPPTSEISTPSQINSVNEPEDYNQNREFNLHKDKQIEQPVDPDRQKIINEDQKGQSEEEDMGPEMRAYLEQMKKYHGSN